MKNILIKKIFSITASLFLVSSSAWASYDVGGISFDKELLPLSLTSESNNGTLPDSAALRDGVGVVIFSYKASNLPNFSAMNSALFSVADGESAADLNPDDFVGATADDNTTSEDNTTTEPDPEFLVEINGHIICDNVAIGSELPLEGDLDGQKYLVVDKPALMATIGDEQSKYVCTSHVTDMVELCISSVCETGTIMETWDTSSVTHFNNMFTDSMHSTWPDITGWDTSSAVVTNGMFKGTNFNQDISMWNMGNLEYASAMFMYNEVFNQPIGVWNPTHLVNISNMFHTAKSFNQDLSNWNTSSVISLSGTFALASAFNGNVSTWNTGSVTNMGSLFVKTSFNGDVSLWNTSNVTIMTNAFHTTPFNGDLSGWDTSSATNIAGMFYNSSFSNGSVVNWDVSSVTTMADLFSNTSFNADISNWNVSSVADFSRMFKDNAAFNQDMGATNAPNWHTSTVQNATHGSYDNGTDAWTLPKIW